MYSESKTLVQLLYNSKEKFGNLPFLKYRENGVYKSITYSEVYEMVESLSASLYDLGVRKGDKVGIVSDNMYKWFITDMAILSLGAVDIPRGSDSTASEISFIMKHGDAKYCFVEDCEQADKALSFIEETPDIKSLILLTGDINDIKNPNKNKVAISRFDNMLVEGKTLKIKYKEELLKVKDSITREDLATLIYTSGTTGLPKGVMLLHKNLMHNVQSLTDVLPFKEGKERWLSVLPVWHVYERTVEYIVLSMGAVLAYSKPTAKHLLPDLAEIKPTYMVSVPRIWEAVYNGIINNMKKESSIRRGFFYFFTGIAEIYVNYKKLFFGKLPVFKKKNIFVSLWDKISSIFVIAGLFIPYGLGNVLVFSKIRKKTGGKFRGIISGGGALPEYIDRFFSSVGIKLLEGYGLTETAPIVGVRSQGSPIYPNTLVYKTVGRPAPGVEVMIGDENWSPLSNQHEKGIIYIKGDLVMAGYYKNPEKTEQILKNGWLNSGDLGRLTITGELQITGRAKDTIVLTGGENVEPEPVENKLLESPLINQIIVVGQDRKTLGALIIPQKENLEEFAKSKNIAFKEFEDLCKNKEIIDEYSAIVKNKINTANGFKSFERITCFTLIATPFEIGKELTLSLKMRRNVIMEKYAETIEEIYSEIS